MKSQERKSTQDEEIQGFSVGRKRAGRVLIQKLNDNDVLQGRGSGSMQNTGNIKFRNLVEKLRPAYVATSSRKEKAKMISDMVQLIQSRKGRFLQRLCDKEVEELGLDSQSGEHPGEQDHYVEMTDEEAAEKAKQAIRYVHYKKVPLEEERRKKRAADNDFLVGDDKTNSEVIHGIGYGGNSLVSAPIPTHMTNQLTQSQLPQSNIRAGAAFPPQNQQPDINQLLASFQTAQTALTAQLSGNDLNAVQAAVHQSSLFRDHASGIMPIAGNVQQQPNPLQRLSSPLFANTNGALPQKVGQAAFLDGTSNQNTNPAQQAQMNVLLQSIIQQQANMQQNSILQTLLQAQQQQEQKQLNSALQTLQQQQQLATAIHSLQQPQKLNTDPQFQQHLQHQKANSILASLLSNGKTHPPMGSTLNPLARHSVQNANATTAGMGPTNALLASFLSNNNAPAAAFQQTGNSLGQGTGKSSNQLLGGLLPSTNTINGSNTMQQQSQGLAGASAGRAIPGLTQNVNSLLAPSASNNALGQAIVTNSNSNKAKRPRLSSGDIADRSN